MKATAGLARPGFDWGLVLFFAVNNWIWLTENVT
jgi:hypothetical protein